jgi:hypothetical protein
MRRVRGVSMAVDLANLMLDHYNNDGRFLDAEEFAYRTQGCAPLERDAVWQALPAWAQRQIEGTMRMLDAGMLA